MTTTLRITSLISLFIIFVSLCFIYVYFANTQNSIIIRLDSYQRETFLGAKTDVLKIVVSGLVLVLLNIFLARITEAKYLFISRILSLGNVLLAILILTVVGVIILLN